MTPLAAVVLTDLGIGAAAGLVIDVRGDDVGEDVDGAVREGRGLGRGIENAEGHLVQQRGVAPPLVVGDEGDQLLGLIVGIDLEGPGEVVVVEGPAARHRGVEGLGLGREILGNDVRHHVRPVREDRLEGDLRRERVHDLDVLNLVVAVVGRPGILLVRAVGQGLADVLGVHGAPVAPYRLVVESRGHHRLPVDLLRLQGGEEVGVGRRRAVLRPQNGVGHDESVDIVQVDAVAVHREPVPVGDRRSDRESQLASLLEGRALLGIEAGGFALGAS